MRVLFFGTPVFACVTLEALYKHPGVTVGAVVTQPDRPAGRGTTPTRPPVKVCAIEHNTPVIQPVSVRRELPQLLDQIASYGPFDIGIVVAFGQLIPPELLAYPRRGCLNIHASLLPRWRGAAPIQRAIEAGDTETGVCLMQMEAGLDTGAVYASARTAIRSQDTAKTLHDTLAQIGAHLLTAQIDAIVAGDLIPQPQPTTDITYATKISTGECAIDWSQPAHVIAQKVRAFSPTPGCFSTLRGKRLKILHAKVASPREHQNSTTPGTIITANPDSLEVRCGAADALSISAVQLEGNKPLSTPAFLRGTPVFRGEKRG
jgi:methionyl-tRNA formyltransferase